MRKYQTKYGNNNSKFTIIKQTKVVFIIIDSTNNVKLMHFINIIEFFHVINVLTLHFLQLKLS